MVVESRVVERLCQEVCMLLLRLYVANANLPLKNKFPQKMVSHVDVFRVRRTHWLLCEVPCPLVILENRISRLPKARKIKLHTHRMNIASLMVSASATYSASVVESVTHFCVLENQHTHAPAHIIAPPETDLLSVALMA